MIASKPRFVALFALTVITACSGSSSSSPPEVDVSGSWTGSWASSNGINAGVISFDLTQVEADVDGSGSLSSSPCFGGGLVSGSVSAKTLRGSLVAGGAEIEFEVTVAGASDESASGSYAAKSAGVCTGDTGSVSVQRVAASTADGSGSRARPALLVSGDSAESGFLVER